MSATHALHGIHILGSLYAPVKDKEEAEQVMSLIGGVLAGLHDDDLLCAFNFRSTGKTDDVEVARFNEFAVASLNVLKSKLRKDVQQAITYANTKAQAELLNKLKQSHQPHAMGTTKEIAQKLNISLSEVRRLKASGALDELFNKES